MGVAFHELLLSPFLIADVQQRPHHPDHIAIGICVGGDRRLHEHGGVIHANHLKFAAPGLPAGNGFHNGITRGGIAQKGGNVRRFELIMILGAK